MEIRWAKKKHSPEMTTPLRDLGRLGKGGSAQLGDDAVADADVAAAWFGNDEPVTPPPA